jgi:hypothetical protein
MARRCLGGDQPCSWLHYYAKASSHALASGLSPQTGAVSVWMSIRSGLDIYAFLYGFRKNNSISLILHNFARRDARSQQTANIAELVILVEASAMPREIQSRIEKSYMKVSLISSCIIMLYIANPVAASDTLGRSRLLH